jgi:hypothetical protein
MPMPARARPRLEPTDDWQQLHLLAQFPEQLTYELIRPVVLFGHSPAERAQQTGAAALAGDREPPVFLRVIVVTSVLRNVADAHCGASRGQYTRERLRTTLHLVTASVTLGRSVQFTVAGDKEVALL